MTVCKHCKHADYAHTNGECVACGCIKFEAKAKRDDRQRTWIVRVAFFEKNRWTPDVEVRVRAQGIGGAAQRAVREVKHQRASKRRVLQTRIHVVPVPRAGQGR
jgi:predicted  nucleic acid-binding Zn-ribbon protein